MTTLVNWLQHDKWSTALGFLTSPARAGVYLCIPIRSITYVPSGFLTSLFLNFKSVKILKLGIAGDESKTFPRQYSQMYLTPQLINILVGPFLATVTMMFNTQLGDVLWHQRKHMPLPRQTLETHYLGMYSKPPSIMTSLMQECLAFPLGLIHPVVF